MAKPPDPTWIPISDLWKLATSHFDDDVDVYRALLDAFRGGVIRIRHVPLVYGRIGIGGELAGPEDDMRITYWDQSRWDLADVDFEANEIRIQNYVPCRVEASRADYEKWIGAEGGGASGATQGRKSGAKEKPFWDKIFVEIIVRADMDGLPDGLEELANDMIEWCREELKEEIGLTTLKDRLRPIYLKTRKKPDPASKLSWHEIYIEIIVRANLYNLPESLEELANDMIEWSEKIDLASLEDRLRPIYSHPRKTRK